MIDADVTKPTRQEQGWLAIMRLNILVGRIEVRKEWRIGRLKIAYRWRSSKNLWGRFGGGWNWKLGAQCGGSTLIVDLLVFSLVFNIERKPPSQGQSSEKPA